jgi:hypothetical protein
MRLDSEVIAWLDKLKVMHGSYNKALRLLAFSIEQALQRDVEDAVSMRAVETPLPDPGTWRETRKPLLKPKDR